MHEISLCQRVRSIIEQQALLENFTRVTKVSLEIGELAAVEPEAMRFGFDVVMKDSIAEQASLEIIAVPGQAVCQQCQRRIRLAQRHDPCCYCGSHALRITSGEQLRVKELEVE